MLDRPQLILLLILILALIYLYPSLESFVWVQNVYGVGGTCNDYIPNYNPCTVSPEFDYPNYEGFACGCSKRDLSRPNITYYYEGFDDIEEFKKNKDKNQILISNDKGYKFYMSDGKIQFRADTKSSQVNVDKNHNMKNYDKFIKINKNTHKIKTSKVSGTEGDYVNLKFNLGYIYYEADKDKYYYALNINKYGGTYSYWFKNIPSLGYTTFRLTKNY